MLKSPKRDRNLSIIAMAAFAVATAQPGFAQDNTSPEGTENEDGTLREIVVTAQKREDSVQSVPLAITAIDDVMLEQNNIDRADALTAFAPNVAVRSFNSALVVATRGISNENTSNLGDASLAFHVDGVFYARPRGTGAIFYDLERVELLRGPQGTLYGRNSTAGALNVITKKPTDSFQFGADFALGNYDERVLRGYVNVPIVEGKAALRATGYFARRDGYDVNNNLNAALDSGNDAGNTAARVHLLLTPTDNFSVLISGKYHDENRVGDARSPITLAPPYSTLGFLAVRQEDPDDPRVWSFTDQPIYHNIDQEVSTEVNWDFTDTARLTLLSAFREDETVRFFNDTDGRFGTSTVDVQGLSRQQSHELRAASTGDNPFEWLAGLYYFREQQSDSADIFRPGGGPFRIFQEQFSIKATSKSAFGQLSYKFDDRLRLFVGLRHTSDFKSRFARSTVSNIPGGPSNVGPPRGVTPIENPGQKWSRTNWKAGVDFQLSDTSMIFATVGTGYKAGGFNNSNPTPFNPEEIVAYEVGIKNDLFGRTLRLNINGFYYDYDNLQVTAPQQVNGQIVALTANAAKARIYGFEIEGMWLPAPWLSFDYALGYLNARFKNFTGLDNVCTTQISTPIPQRPTTTNGGLCPATTIPGPPGAPPRFANVPQDFSGNTLANAPEWTLSIGANVTMMDNENGKVIGRVRGRYVGDSFLSEYNRAPDLVEGYFQTDASLNYESANGRYSVSAFVQNLENNDTIGSLAVTNVGFTASYLPPRTYGLRVGIKFD
jgi:iron complex outermembrane recepter protein